MRTEKVAIAGAGIGGLVTALELARRGYAVEVFERQSTPGGKLSQADLGGHLIDMGPTVLTMRWVLDNIFAAAGADLREHLLLYPLTTLARHAWSDTERLDLYADMEATVDAIGRFSSRAEALRYREFHERARKVYEALVGPFIRAERPSVAGMLYKTRLDLLPTLMRIEPHASLWRQLVKHFVDPRLRQLFGRYATYTGSSPFQCPATLMLISHVEQEGVWGVRGGMQQIARALGALARARGVTFHYDADVREVLVDGGRASGLALADGTRVAADAVVVNADVAALADGTFGAPARKAAAAVSRSQRSLSALTFTMVAEARGFPLSRHNVFFGSDSAREFAELFEQGRLPSDPTVYVCAQERELPGEPAANAAAPGAGQSAAGPQPLFILVNAPATADSTPLSQTEISSCEERTFGVLERCGLRIERPPGAMRITTPSDFHRRFPSTGGALYGQASHGWMASFQRPGARSRIPGLYLTGGSTHPGPGVPMAALSGRHAAAAVALDLISTRRFIPAAIAGGTSTR